MYVFASIVKKKKICDTILSNISFSDWKLVHGSIRQSFCHQTGTCDSMKCPVSVCVRVRHVNRHNYTKKKSALVLVTCYDNVNTYSICTCTVPFFSKHMKV